MSKPENCPTVAAHSLIGASPSTALAVALSAVIGLMNLGQTAQARDILRPNMGGNNGAPAPSAGARPHGPSVAAQLRATGNDRLSRTTEAVQAVRQMQNAARNAARSANNAGTYKGMRLPNVPNGLGKGGLQVAPGVPLDLKSPKPGENSSLWVGANLPKQTVSGGKTKVTIKQTRQQALLHWGTFNIGKDTIVHFNQTAGGSNASKWIAFNKIHDPSGVPSQILGSIKAEGQVYLINQNGIIFGGASQINVRGLVASALPINDNLIGRGLLNNPDAQFLFSSLPLAGGADGTPGFYPTTSDAFTVAEGGSYTFVEPLAVSNDNTPLRPPTLSFKAADGTRTLLVAGTDYNVTADAATKKATVSFTTAGLEKVGDAQVSAIYAPKAAKAGDVIVRRGAVISSPTNADGNGGRVMLVGANVKNAGTISTPSGQTVLAAGLQVGIAPHASSDPSLRGLDVWVGAVDGQSGTATNSGLIESFTGSTLITGKRVNQLGAIDSTTSVSLNGRIDLRASYGAVSNPNFDLNSGAAPIFLNQKTGLVSFGEGSVTRILPDYLSESTVPGTELPENSQINAEGLAIHFRGDAMMMAPSGDISLRAGTWSYRDLNGDGTIFDDQGNPEPRLNQHYSGANQRFFFSGGQIYMDRSSFIDVSGSTDVYVPLAHSILDVEFRGSELADSPLQRNGLLRATALTVDLRRTGVSNGRFWMGTPLGDATGLAGLIQRNAAQLTARGGNVSLRAGGSIVLKEGSAINVSGGYYRHEGGMVQTSRLLHNGNLIDIAAAQPGLVYDGIYTGRFTEGSAKWGVSKTYSIPFMAGARYEPGYLEGAAGGNVALVAPSMALDGRLMGRTLQNPRERSLPPAHSSISIAFNAEKIFEVSATSIQFIPTSPTPPAVTFSDARQTAVPSFQLAADGSPVPLPAERLASVFLSPALLEEDGFGHLNVENTDGDITLPAGTRLSAPAKGSITLKGANVSILGDVSAPGGKLSFTALTISPAFKEEFQLANPGASAPVPVADPSRGNFVLGNGGSMSTAGLIVDDRDGAPNRLRLPEVIDGGSVSVTSYNARLESGSKVDVSGGVAVSVEGDVSYGKGGSISISAGSDPGYPEVIGGELSLGTAFMGYSGSQGGSLSLRSSLVQIGGATASPGVLWLQPDFFRTGGFTSYSISGIGALAGTPAPGKLQEYIPAVNIAPGTRIEPVAESLLAIPHNGQRDRLGVTRILLPEGQRAPVSLSFSAAGVDDKFTVDLLEARGDIRVGRGVEIVTDAGASVSFKGDTVTLLGSVQAPGGTITIDGKDSFPLVGAQDANAAFARATVYIGASAELSAKGAEIFLPDAFGRRIGTLYSGGTISVSGNIVAERGASLDVSGASATFDVHPGMLGLIGNLPVPVSSGTTSPLWSLRSVPLRMDSAGGVINLHGGEMLFSDATLMGGAGGPTAAGGTLSIFSGRFYAENEPRTSADINLVVTQGGLVLTPDQKRGVGLPVLNEAGTEIKGLGYFSADRFASGRFHSLDLGAVFVEDANPFPFGGNVQFRGPVSINAPGAIRIAAGGVIQADSSVTLSGSYVRIGQPFRAPLHPDDPVELFQQIGVGGAQTGYKFAPTFGAGSLVIDASVIDTGHVSMQGIGRAQLIAHGGDVRGNGTLSIAGDLTITAGQIYPTTAGEFTIVAHDRNLVVTSAASGNTQVTLASPVLPPGFGVGSSLLGSKVASIEGLTVTLESGANATVSANTAVPFASGSITIIGSGSPAAPLAGGGRLGIFASKITQGGTVRSPLGSITIGWDGTDFDPSTTAFDRPIDAIAGSSLSIPIARNVVLKAGSITSVSAVQPTGEAMIIPYGLSPDGLSWIDPRGENVTVSGLPAKSVAVAGDRVSTQKGSVIDIGGGGDLYAFRWIPGLGGSTDLLGTATNDWGSGTEYNPGDLVRYNGRTWSARVRHSGEEPTASLFWSLVPESFAVMPGYTAQVAPYTPFNTGANSAALGGEAGYVSTGLKIGDRVFLDGGAGLGAGVYTLLPSRYALLPGAFLITPGNDNPVGTLTLPDGTSLTGGYRFNDVNRPQELASLRNRFEVLSSEVLRTRAQYDDYSANTFMLEAARRFELKTPQRLPMDSGHLSFHGNTVLATRGAVTTARPEGGRGATVDLSSFGDIHIVGGRGTAPVGTGTVLNAALLQSWGAESLLIGGLRHNQGGATVIDVRTNNLVLDNRGSSLSAPDITLASKGELTVAAGSSITVSGGLTSATDTFQINGDGALIRVSGDAGAGILRTNTTTASTPVLTIGEQVVLGGASIILDSTYGTSLATTTDLRAGMITLGSGQISVVLGDANGPAGGDPQLTLAGQFLADVQRAQSLTLRSYGTIDFYGDGSLNLTAGGRLVLAAGGLRGFEPGSEGVTLSASDVLFTNPSAITDPTAPATASGRFTVDAGTISIGDNTFSLLGYENIQLNAASGLVGRSKGTLATPGNIMITTPVITGVRGSTASVTAGGSLVIERGGGGTRVEGGLGASFTLTGAEVLANADIVLPSGQLTLRATQGDVQVGGNLDVSGTRKEFYDLIRFSNAGSITLSSDHGDVQLLADSRVSVNGAEGGGNAGTLTIKASEGVFENNGATLLGKAAAGMITGRVLIDVGFLDSLTDVSRSLNIGGFFQQRNVRVRTGDVLVENIDGGAHIARDFTISADTGSITVTGTIDASGKTGGNIALLAGGSLILQDGSKLTVHAQRFSSAGKGGDVRLEAGAAVDGVANTGAVLDIQTGSTIDLGVDAFVDGSYTTPGSSAFYGQFNGKLHLRAPRVGNDIAINSIGGSIVGASAVIAEGYRIYDRTGNGALNNTVKNQIHADNTAYINAGYDAMREKLLAGNPDSAALDAALVVAPGVEIINRTGDLTLGSTANNSANDWNLATFRYGPAQAAGVLTLRAAGDLVVLNALSDGFSGGVPGGTPAGQQLWLSRIMTIKDTLPVNAQSWSFRLAAGADFSSSNFEGVRTSTTVPSGTGSLLLGKFYDAELVSGTNATTANAINNRYQVIRTGTGDIDIATAGDIQLRNQFASIYTAGIGLPDPETIFANGDFQRPLVDQSSSRHPSQGGLGALQQIYPAQWSMAGGNLDLSAGGNIGRYTEFQGQVVIDSTRQLPNNWLYRRGYVDAATGRWGVGGVNGTSPPTSVTDPSASLTWWVDFSNFFQGFGALGGGDISLIAGSDIVNADAAIPTNARMPGRDPLTGNNVAPDASKLVELGGGDLTVRAGRNIDGGTYYVERGAGTLDAGGEIKTNASRSPSPGILGFTDAPPSSVESVFPGVFDSRTWLPTTLFVGKSNFDVSARGDVLLGPVTNPFLLPQGLNNKFWYKTYFNTFSEDAGADVASIGGSVTHRMSITLPGATNPQSILGAWLSRQNLIDVGQPERNASNYQPWIRLAETGVGSFGTMFTVVAPTLRSTAFAGDVNLVGTMNLLPSAKGTLELAASGSIVGLHSTGRSVVQGRDVTVWTAASVNLSDANPASIPGITNPLAYTSFVGRVLNDSRESEVDFYNATSQVFLETGSYIGQSATPEVQLALHAPGVLHSGDANPVRLYASGGQITGLELFSPKATRIIADGDITDVSFYIQNTNPGDISLVSSGRDIVPFNENAPVRALANDLTRGNLVGDPSRGTVTGVLTNVMAGDIQISGPGVLEVLAGRDLDLGTGANFADGTGSGITSIGASRNPFLPQEGADIVALAGVGGVHGGAAQGLASSSLDFASFIEQYVKGADLSASPYLSKLSASQEFEDLTEEQQALVALEVFFDTLRTSGRAAATTKDYSAGVIAAETLFGTETQGGDIFTRARDLRTTAGGAITIAAPGGGLTLASDIFGNPLTPPGIVTEFGGAISVFTDGTVDIGQARLFTLRGGNIVMWSATGDIGAGTAAKTVVTAPPTRVLFDTGSAAIQTDLGGLATGGGIGVLASVEGVEAGDVDLIAPQGEVDAGDAGIRVTGNLNIAAVAVLNAANIQVGGTAGGVPSAAPVAAPNIGALSAASNTSAATNTAASQVAQPRKDDEDEDKEKPSIIVAEVIGYGGGEG